MEILSREYYIVGLWVWLSNFLNVTHLDWFCRSIALLLKNVIYFGGSLTRTDDRSGSHSLLRHAFFSVVHLRLCLVRNFRVIVNDVSRLETDTLLDSLEKSFIIFLQRFVALSDSCLIFQYFSFNNKILKEKKNVSSLIMNY